MSSASTVAPSATHGDAKAPAGKTPEVENQVGNFKRTTRDGKTFWCEETAFTGSKLTKTRCLTETEYAALKEANRNFVDRWNRTVNEAVGDPAATGQQAPTY